MPSSECRSWEFETALFENTFVTQNNLVCSKKLYRTCSKKLYRTHAIVAYMAGYMIGSFGIGIFSAKFGRKVVLMASIVLYIGSSIPLSFVNEFIGFAVLRSFSGVSVGGLLSTCYVMDLELVGPHKRMLAGMVYMLFWGLGALLLTGMAYLIRDWRNLNLSLALQTISFLFYIMFVVFLGLSWNVSNLGDDVFLNFFLTSIAQIVGFLLCFPLLNRVGRKPVYVVSLFTGGIALLLTIFPLLYGSSDIEWMTISLSFVGMTGSSMAFASIFLYSAELFPTVVRNSGLTPYIPDLSQVVSGDVGRILPMSIFGGLAVIAGFLSLLLPETNNQRLPETLDDAVFQNKDLMDRDVGNGK